MSSILLSIQRGFGMLSSKPIGTRDQVLEVVIMTRRVRVNPRVRVGSGRNSEYGSGTGTGKIMGYGYGSGSTNAVPADLYFLRGLYSLCFDDQLYASRLLP